MTPIVHIVSVGSTVTESVANVTEIHDGLDFAAHDGDDDDFGIFSVKFSTDGRELVASSNDNSIYLYDLEANRRSLRIPAHKMKLATLYILEVMTASARCGTGAALSQKDKQQES
uniref:LEC14B family protein n=2 Tax=Rhizophora mucronata TaxID=61149 RepID=A0A2P2LTJ3_RHIMU